MSYNRIDIVQAFRSRSQFSENGRYSEIRFSRSTSIDYESVQDGLNPGSHRSVNISFESSGRLNQCSRSRNHGSNPGADQHSNSATTHCRRPSNSQSRNSALNSHQARASANLNNLSPRPSMSRTMNINPSTAPNTMPRHGPNSLSSQRPTTLPNPGLNKMPIPAPTTLPNPLNTIPNQGQRSTTLPAPLPIPMPVPGVNNIITTGHNVTNVINNFYRPTFNGLVAGSYNATFPRETRSSESSEYYSIEDSDITNVPLVHESTPIRAFQGLAFGSPSHTHNLDVEDPSTVRNQ